MKKYFTKYLPVSGVIKEGETFISKGKVGKSYSKDYRLTDAKPCKLFLCSGDIDFVKELQEDPSSVNIYHDGSLPSFKVIGQISPDVSNISEGQEFNEEDVKISLHPICPKCRAISNDGFCSEEQDCQIEKARTVVFIKCSMGHFH